MKKNISIVTKAKNYKVKNLEKISNQEKINLMKD